MGGLRDNAAWVLDLWRAASALLQATVPYRERDARLRAAWDALDGVLNGARRR